MLTRIIDMPFLLSDWQMPDVFYCKIRLSLPINELNRFRKLSRIEDRSQDVVSGSEQAGHLLDCVGVKR
ncbi:hypothetical protein D3C84_626960 [compost metagenome]